VFCVFSVLLTFHYASFDKYSHHNYSILTTGEGADPNQRNHIHYTSVYDNKLLRTFRGHTAEIVNLSINPTNDLFLSSSNDHTVRLWSLSQPACIAQMELPVDATAGTPFAAYDATGLLFGVTAAMTHGKGNVSHQVLVAFIHSKRASY